MATGLVILFFSLIMAIIVVVKAAEMEGMNRLVWGLVTFTVCLLCTALPIRSIFLQILIGFIISFALLFAFKEIKKRRQ